MIVVSPSNTLTMIKALHSSIVQTPSQDVALLHGVIVWDDDGLVGHLCLQIYICVGIHVRVIEFSY